MHIAVLNANVDRSSFARRWPDDGHKVVAGLRPQRPGWSYRVWQACDGELPPESDTADGWVITGSVASVNDEAPWMLALEARVRARHERRQSTVGLCFGHQLIAKALGARVGPSPGGWRLGVATTTLAGPPPAWMQPALPAFDLFALHEEQVLVPPAAARVLGGDAFTPHAALQLGEHILTTQYHPELSREFVLAVLAAHGSEWPAEQVAQAGAQFSQQPVDAERFMQWLARFFERPAQVPGAAPRPVAPEAA